MDLHNMLYVLALIVTSLQFVSGLTPLEQLHGDLFSSYVPEVSPSTGPGDKLQVGIGFVVNKIIDVEEAKHVLWSGLWLRLIWTDPRLTWDSTLYNDTTVMSTTQSVWKPDITLFEDVREEERPLDKFPVQLSSAGVVTWSYHVVYRSNCKLDVTFFPFDVQECIFTFASASNPAYIDVYNLTDSFSTFTYESNGEWDLLSAPSKVNLLYFPCCPNTPFSEVVLTVRMKRQPLFYTTNLIAPVILQSFLAAFSFLLPAESGEKASLTVTIFLSQVVFAIVIVGYLPVQSTGMPLLSSYLTIVNILMALSTVLNVYVISVHFRGSHGGSVPPWVKRIIIYRLGTYVGKGDTVKKYKIRDNQVAAMKSDWTRVINATQAASGALARLRQKTRIGPTSDVIATAGEKMAIEELDEVAESEPVVNETRPSLHRGGTTLVLGPEESEDVNKQILRELQKLNLQNVNQDKNDLLKLEWSLVATIIDRMFFIIFILLIFSVTLIIPISQLSAPDE